jgi:hypothetical protein
MYNGSIDKQGNDMLTASYLAFESGIRKEFLDMPSHCGWVGVDPIDAPDFIAAGAWHSVTSYATPKFEYGLPMCVYRNDFFDSQL